MKIGILTYHRALNYGAALQGFALTEYLRSIGLDAEVVDYRCPRIESDYYKLIPANAKGLKAVLKAVIRYPMKKKRAAGFRSFEDKYKYVSDKSYTKESLVEANKVYDTFISGSDQIWNNYGSDSDFHYFLDFAENNKKIIAYSASFGYENVPNFLTEDYKRLLKRYNALATREASGAKIIEELIGEKAIVTCDPVLLLNAKMWKDRIDCTRKVEGKYLLCYFLATNEKALAYAVEYANKNGLKVIAINNIQKDYPGVEMAKYVSPEEFVSLFANAEAVMTDSFHGTVFSLTFNKLFNSLVSSTSKVNSRIENILGRVGLKSHIVNDFEDSDWNVIDYDEVNKAIEQYRKESTDYLTAALY